ncbi:hypothetical protein P9G84_21600 [Brevibacillus centrosporus]|uniref:hypothetical protein n=1 Tax=Brevibacillus centrosporus TaxID=54910 RepID=UPI000F09D6AF|nr:hypothetical protein [Brevibacillus centrosporus]MEC2131521.1 hypothetical protein [Brevibacillus centrosporus]RNB72017.1 hypothetical protein EDM55_06355 [Brevibacillus centrosporus]GED32535.1 hypothetical protein BCE02nite_36760 [Brevibacillus centrosporus]
MIEKVMELRGIPVSALVTYLTECGGEAKSESLPIQVVGDQWQAEVLREERVRITSRFHVNAVFIRITALERESFDRLMAQFRLKVMRVGG